MDQRRWTSANQELGFSFCLALAGILRGEPHHVLPHSLCLFDRCATALLFSNSHIPSYPSTCLECARLSPFSHFHYPFCFRLETKWFRPKWLRPWLRIMFRVHLNFPKDHCLLYLPSIASSERMKSFRMQKRVTLFDHLTRSEIQSGVTHCSNRFSSDTLLQNRHDSESKWSHTPLYRICSDPVAPARSVERRI